MTPTVKLKSSPRAKGAIAAVLAASVGGFVTIWAGQPAVHDDVTLAIEQLVTPWEGTKLRAYLDTLPKKSVWTICEGDTDNVKPGMVETPEGCNKRLATKLERDYRKPLTQCIPNFDSKPIGWRAMMDSLAWNIGVGATCNSTAARLGNQGQYLASCNAATAFNKAGGRIIIGIVRRREMGDATRIGEGEICVSGL
jgi:GH24 family phage-related lysozyme (muramidase)